MIPRAYLRVLVFAAVAFALSPIATAAALVAEPTAPDASKVEVRMDPFKVMAEQMEIGVSYVQKDGLLYIDRMEVVAVTKGSAAEAAGVRRGMKIIRMYGVPVAGRRVPDFVNAYSARASPERLVFLVSSFFGKPREIEIVWPKSKNLATTTR